MVVSGSAQVLLNRISEFECKILVQNEKWRSTSSGNTSEFLDNFKCNKSVSGFIVSSLKSQYVYTCCSVLHLKICHGRQTEYSV